MNIEPTSEKKETIADSAPRRSNRATKEKQEQDDDPPKQTKRQPKLKQDVEPKVTKKHQKLAEQHDIPQLQDIAHQLRILSIEMVNSANSGHATSCASMAEIMAVLFFDPSGMHYNPQKPRNFANDRFVLSKGHAAPILYAAQSIAGYIDPKELNKIRQFTCDLEGHPTPRLPFVDVATGSLGQGLSVAAGMAYSSKYLDKLPNRYYVMIGDGESAEGSIWEACNLSSYYKLNNLTLILDANRLGQSEPTLLQHDVETYRKRFESFGWAAFKVDGHNLFEVVEAFEKCRNVKDQPQVIIAKTFKGKYIEGIEDQLDWHGKPVGIEKSAGVLQHLRSLQKQTDFTLKPTQPELTDIPYPELPHLTLLPDYQKGTKIATRKAYGKALVRLSKDDAHKQLVALDADTKNSTFALTYKEAVPSNFVECFIAEQNMVGWAQGLACRSKIAFASTFGCFFSRAYDQIRMGGISQTQIKCIGSHSGVSIGEDGPSQMALEDLAMFRSIPDSVVLYPSDGVSAERAIELAANHRGLVYVRTSRPEASVVYNNDEVFKIGQAKVFGEHSDSEIVIVAGGVTFHEALSAQKYFESQNVRVTVVDIFSVKPFDKQTVLNLVNSTRTKSILTVEDHYLQGGLFETVSSAFSDLPIKVYGLGVTSIPRSGKPEELLAFYHIDSNGIIQKVKSLIK